MDTQQLARTVDTLWDQDILPALKEYIRIPAKSPHFDPDWQRHGHIEEAVQLAARWCQKHAVPGMTLEIERIESRTPLLYIDVPATEPGAASSNCVLLYGHLDKQPEFTGWRDGTSPWEPKTIDDRLYGRGGADDGYAVFSSLAAILALHQQHIAHSRCVILIELCEESGSYDLPFHFERLASRIGDPRLVVCLDAECGNYDQLWCTTSLRGNLVGTLRVEVLTEGIHSGGAGGIVPSSLRILRGLLERVERNDTGEILPAPLIAKIPGEREHQAQEAAETLGDELWHRFPFVDKAHPDVRHPVELVLANTWKACLEVTGADGFPSPSSAGNVLRPWSAFKLSFRLPPTVDPQKAAQAVKEAFEIDPPYGARVEFEVGSAMGGWNAPPLAPWLQQAMQKASQQYFANEVRYMGTGGSIPFMGFLATRYANANFLVTGLLGPHSNAHGPNEFLHIPTAKKLTSCVASILEAEYRSRD